MKTLSKQAEQLAKLRDDLGRRRNERDLARAREKQLQAQLQALQAQYSAQTHAAGHLEQALLTIIGDHFPPGTDCYEQCRQIAAEALGYEPPEPLQRRPGTAQAERPLNAEHPLSMLAAGTLQMRLRETEAAVAELRADFDDLAAFVVPPWKRRPPIEQEEDDAAAPN